RGTKHALLLFCGVSATADEPARLASIAAREEAQHGEVLAAHIVVPATAKTDALESMGSVVLDPEGAIHARYGARSESLYLVRPDVYMGYGSQRADSEKLGAYLRPILLAS